jgi:hypothetical protein
VQVVVQRDGGFQVVAEGLLDDDPAPVVLGLVQQPDLAQVVR